MLPEHMQEKLWGEISRWFGNESPMLKRAALKLQDMGVSDDEVRQIMSDVWGPAFNDGYAEGQDATQ